MNDTNQTRKLLIVDDDPIFRKAISRVAKKKQIPLTVCATLEDLKQLEDPNSYHAALIDYYLDDVLNGADVASIMGSIPVVMMSNQTEHCLEEHRCWPTTVRKFISKEKGYEALLDMALKVSVR